MSESAGRVWRWFAEWPEDMQNVLGKGEWRYSTGDDFHPDYAELMIPAQAVRALADRLNKRDLHIPNPENVLSLLDFVADELRALTEKSEETR